MITPAFLQACNRCMRNPVQKVKLSPHKLRHTYAIYLRRSGVDIGDVQKRLGHTNIATTQIYSHVDIADLRKSVNLLTFKKRGKYKLRF